MKDNKTKIKKEKGATGLDVATGVVIFMLFSTFILTLYVQIYKQTSIIKIHDTVYNLRESTRYMYFLGRNEK